MKGCHPEKMHPPLHCISDLLKQKILSLENSIAKMLRDAKRKRGIGFSGLARAKICTGLIS